MIVQTLLLCFDVCAGRFAASRQSRRRAAGLALLVVVLLAISGATTHAQPATPPTKAGVIETVKIEPTSSDRVEIWILADADLDLVGVRVDRDHLLALQIPRHILGPDVEDLYPSDGLIQAVRSRVEQTPHGPLARIELGLRLPAAYDLSADDGRLRLRLWPQGEESAEDVLRRQVTELESALTTAERARDDLADRLEELKTVQLGNGSPKGADAAPAISAPADEDTSTESGPRPEVADTYRFIVAASLTEQRAATALSAGLRGKGYASEIYWSGSGYYVVTLGWLPHADARRVRDKAVRNGDVAKDTYLALGTTLLSRVDP